MNSNNPKYLINDKTEVEKIFNRYSQEIIS
jgi:hypothetical protein